MLIIFGLIIIILIYLYYRNYHKKTTEISNQNFQDTFNGDSDSDTDSDTDSDNDNDSEVVSESIAETETETKTKTNSKSKSTTKIKRSSDKTKDWVEIVNEEVDEKLNKTEEVIQEVINQSYSTNQKKTPTDLIEASEIYYHKNQKCIDSHHDKATISFNWYIRAKLKNYIEKTCNSNLLLDKNERRKIYHQRIIKIINEAPPCEEIIDLYLVGDTDAVDIKPSPTEIPTYSPTQQPTFSPTKYPMYIPTNFPIGEETYPTHHPTQRPTERPTEGPTKKPTQRPTKKPTQRPTEGPTHRPTKKPTQRPTKKPTQRPTERPTHRPTKKPTQRPTKKPTQRPTEGPTHRPTKKPTGEWSSWGQPILDDDCLISDYQDQTISDSIYGTKCTPCPTCPENNTVVIDEGITRKSQVIARPYSEKPPNYRDIPLSVSTEAKNYKTVPMCCTSLTSNEQYEPGWMYLPSEVKNAKLQSQNRSQNRSQNKSKNKKNSQEPVPNLTNGYPYDNLKFQNVKTNVVTEFDFWSGAGL